MKGTAITEDDRASAIIQSLDEAAIVLDEAETITDLNEVAASTLGVRREEVLGLTLSDLDDRNPDSIRMRTAFELAVTAASEQYSELNLKVQGRVRTYLMKLAPLRASDGCRFGTLIILHDITQSRDESRTRSNAAAAAAHELNTPLTSISLAIGLLRRNAEKQNELMRGIVEDVDRMHRASVELFSIVPEQPRSIPLRNVKFDLGRIVTIVSRKFEVWTREKNVKLRVHTQNGLEVSGDPLKLLWVLASLVSNALRYTPTTGTIDLIAEREHSQVRISVRDNGPGLPENIRALVFTRPTLSPSAVLESTTIGLGLAIAKEIIEVHGGRLSAETLEYGSALFFTIPASQ